MNPSRVSYCGLFFLGVLVLRGYGIGLQVPDNPRASTVVERFNAYQQKYPGQKVHLHLNKSTFLVGEHIWYAAYLVDAMSHLPDTLGKEVYVELIDDRLQVVASRVSRVTMGTGAGDLFLHDSLPPGNYQLRAYTNWMQNFDPAFFFSATIHLQNPGYGYFVNRQEFKEIRRFNREWKAKNEKLELQYMPEGGYLVEGLPSRVAVKITNLHGLGQKGEGVVMGKGGQVTSFQVSKRGTGNFYLTPVAGERYTIRIKTDNGRTASIPVDRPLARGYVMQVITTNPDTLVVITRGNLLPTLDPVANELLLVGHVRGRIQFTRTLNLKDNLHRVEIPLEGMPRGILHLTLLDHRLNALAERLVFARAGEMLDPRVERFTGIDGDTSLYLARVKDNYGLPVSSTLSVAINQGNMLETNLAPSILANLMLTSDLSGYIEDPDAFFIDDSPGAREDLDILLLTQDWQRFEWSSVLGGKPPAIQFPREGGLVVRGRVTRNFFNIPVPGAKVHLSVMDKHNDVYTTLTDGAGRFAFLDLDYHDTLNIRVEAWGPTGRRNIVIVMEDTIRPPVRTPFPVTPRMANYSRAEIKMANRRFLKAQNELLKQASKDGESRNPYSIHQKPKDVLYPNPGRENYSNMLQYLQGRVAGVQVMGDKVIIRGIGTIYGSTDPLFLLDGVQIDASAVRSLNPNDIERVEVLKGPEAAIYGVRGANGVIAFYSRRGQFIRRGVLDLYMMGYHIPRAFQLPELDKQVYDTPAVEYPLFWQPRVKVGSNGLLLLRLPEVEGEKQVHIEVLADDGTPGVLKITLP